MRFRRILLPGTTAAVVAAVVSAVVGGPNIASAASTSLHTVLAQLHRNSKVSERLNAGFFRAPQTQGFVGSMFRPTDSDTAFSVNSTDHSLQLKAQRPGNSGPVTPGSGGGADTVTLTPVDQTQGVFEAPIQIPNRAKVIKVQASYADSSGNNTTTGGNSAPSGFKFEVLSVGLTGGSPTELLNNPAGLRSTDGKTGTDTLGLANNGFQVNNSTSRYVLRVTIDDTNANTKFYGITIQYVIGKGVPGAPS
ncbi:MAG TPA: hypothetical protein VF032_04285 [Thermoleophilaceae bacterium]